MKPLRIFIGADERQPLAANVLAHSITRRAVTKPVTISMLKLSTLAPFSRVGLTEFTYSRYLVPWLCDYDGWALFADSDMLVLGDIAELFALADDQYGAMVVKNALRFEWPSLMLFNCAKCRVLDPDYVTKYSSPQDFGWAGKVGALPNEWNHCVGYDEHKPAKLVHYTQGIPIWHETRECDYSQEWMEEMKDMERACSWSEIMAASVHARPVLERMFKGYAQAQIAQAKKLQAH